MLRKGLLLTAAAMAILVSAPAANAQAIRNLPGFLKNSVPRNDDGSSSFVKLPFPVNFFGRLRSGCYVNNNGNITFDSALSTFTPFGLERTQREIIAAFFADVDTRSELSKLVTYGVETIDGHTAFGVDYLSVGYYASHADRLNSFQLILIDRSDTGSGNFDVEFNYGRISWETGDASGGAGGLGGTPAAVGWSNGSGDPGTSFELAGSLVVGAFLDNGPRSLVRRKLNTSVVGRYIFRARDGQLSPGLAITSGNTLPDGVVGLPYTYQFEATGSSDPYRWSLLPDPGQTLPGLSLSSGGLLTGTPTAGGTYEFTVNVITKLDNVDQTLTQRVAISIQRAALQIQSLACPLADGSVGAPYRQSLYATGAPGPYLWSWGEDGKSPVPGLMLSSDGIVTGTPTVGGSYNFELRVNGSAASGAVPAKRPCAVNIRTPSSNPLISACPAEFGTLGVLYAEALLAIGGKAPYRWQIGGALPPGILFDGSGKFAGIATSTGTFPFYVQLTDADGKSVQSTCRISIGNSSLTLATPCPLPPGETGASYRQPLSVTGGTAPYFWVTNGKLPGGLALDGGAITGIPNDGGNASFLLIARDASGNAVAKACSLSVTRAAMSVTSCPLPPARLGAAYRQQLAVRGGSAPYIWTGQGFPEGLTLSSFGRLDGAPTKPGETKFTVTISEAGGSTVDQQCSLYVEPKQFQIESICPLPKGAVGSFYRAYGIASGGIAPYRWSLSGKLLPSVSLSADGIFSGTPSSPAQSNFTLIALDMRGLEMRRSCSLDAVLPALPDIRFTGLPTQAPPASGPVTFKLQLDRPYPLPIDGEVTLTRSPNTGAADGEANRLDPALLFRNGRTVETFRIPADALQSNFTIASPGTVASSNTVAVTRLSIAGQDLLTLPGAATFEVPRRAPVLTSACYVNKPGALNLQLAGSSSTRELTSMTVELNGVSITDTPLSSYASDYFTGDLSVRTGGAFQISIPVQTEQTTTAVPVASLNVTIRNRIGEAKVQNVGKCN